MEYSEEQNVCTQQTSLSLTEVADELDIREERYEMHCQESQTDIESSYTSYYWNNTMIIS